MTTTEKLIKAMSGGNVLNHGAAVKFLRDVQSRDKAVKAGVYRKLYGDRDRKMVS